MTSPSPSQTPGVYQVRTASGVLPLSVPNYVLDGDGFYVSYNDRDVRIYGAVTTALVKGQMEKFFILKGDHRQAYAPLLAKGFDACLDYFKSLTQSQHPFSDPLPSE